MYLEILIFTLIALLLMNQMRKRQQTNNLESEHSSDPQLIQSPVPQMANTEQPNTIIDEVALDKLVNEVSAEILPTLIDVFVKELVTRCKAVEQLPHDGSDPRLRVEIHSLKSCARTFGATGFAEQAQLIERMIDGHPGDIETQINRLQQLLPGVLGVFSAFQSQLPSR